VDVRIRAHSVEIGTSRLMDIKVLAIHLLKYGSRTKTAVRYVSSTAAPRLQTQAAKAIARGTRTFDEKAPNRPTRGGPPHTMALRL